MGDDYAAFAQDPRHYLTNLYQFPPSREAVAKLAGNVASSLREERNAQIAALYVQAAARHLPAAATAAGAPLANSNKGAASVAAGKADVEMEMRNTQQVFEVVEVCPSVCTTSAFL